MYHLDIYGLSSDSLDWISLGNRHDSPGKILVLIVFFRTSIILRQLNHKFLSLDLLSKLPTSAKRKIIKCQKGMHGFNTSKNISILI
ncbi:hypothetical protein HMPREF1002_05118 [Porphyromonas sp. 31_2]|nr:hypothetical protein HMPREF1002_05118 [Porphyromonas sp. 31_2]